MKNFFLSLTLVTLLSLTATAQVTEVLHREDFTSSSPSGIVSSNERYGFFNLGIRYAWISSNATPQCNLTNSSGGRYYQTNSGTYNTNTRQLDFNVNLSTVDYVNIKLSWNAYRSGGATGTVELYYSTNGQNYSSLSNWTDNTSTGTWRTVNNGIPIQLPTQVHNAANLRFRLVISIPNGGYYAIDDFTVTGEDKSGRAKLDFGKVPAGDQLPAASNKKYKGTDNKDVTLTRTSGSGVAFVQSDVNSNRYQSPTKTLTLVQTGANTTTGTTLTSSFSEPVDELSFTIFDVDNQSGQFRDVLYIEGYLAGMNVPLKSSNVQTSNYNEYIATTNTIQALTAYNDVAATSDAANVTVTFDQPVDEVIIRYYNGDAIRNNSGQQGIGIHNMYWKDPITPLPVELLSFKGKITTSGAALNWNTASETDNEKFVIERSSDGHTFTEIGEVAGKGTTTKMSSYSFTDNKMPSGISYYRLAQTDFDGTISYSRTIALQPETKATEVKLYPNPATENITIQLPTAGAPAVVRILDMNGRQTGTTLNITETTTIPVTDLQPGIYILAVEQNQQQQLIRFIKR